MKAKFRKLIMCLLVFALMVVLSCASQRQKKVDPTALPTDTQEKLYKWQEMYKSVIDQTGWLLPLLVLGGVAGVIVSFKKPDFGVPLLVGCAYGTSVLMAISFKPTLVAYIGIIGGVGLAVAVAGYKIYKTGFKHVVLKGQMFKARNPEMKQEFNDVQAGAQSKTIRKMVKKVKEKK